MGLAIVKLNRTKGTRSQLLYKVRRSVLGQRQSKLNLLCLKRLWLVIAKMMLHA